MDEFLALAYHQERGLDAVIVRLFNTVGPRQSGQYGMVIPRFVERALAGEPLEIHGDGKQTRCFCHVAGHDPRARGPDGRARATSGEIFNVGSTERVTILDLAERVNRSHRLELGDRRTSRTTRSTARASRTCSTAHPAIEKVPTAIGWQPERDLDGILADVIEHARCTPATASVEPVGSS